MAVDRDKRVDFAISTVNRPRNYIHKLLPKLRRNLPLRLVVGSPDYEYLRRYGRNRNIEIIGVDSSDWMRFKNYSVRHRASWNYWRCLTLGIQRESGRRGLVVLEDDVLPAKNWEKRFYRTITEIEQHYGEHYVLTLYTSYTGLSRAINTKSYFRQYPPNRFFGTQAMYFPEQVRIDFADYLRAEGVVLFRTHYDLLLSEFLSRTGVPLFVTLPSLFEHIGEVGTGLAPFFHKAGRFSKALTKS